MLSKARELILPFALKSTNGVTDPWYIPDWPKLGGNKSRDFLQMRKVWEVLKQASFRLVNTMSHRLLIHARPFLSISMMAVTGLINRGGAHRQLKVQLQAFIMLNDILNYIWISTRKTWLWWYSKCFLGICATWLPKRKVCLTRYCHFFPVGSSVHLFITWWLLLCFIALGCWFSMVGRGGPCGVEKLHRPGS